MIVSFTVLMKRIVSGEDVSVIYDLTDDDAE